MVDAVIAYQGLGLKMPARALVSIGCRGAATGVPAVSAPDGVAEADDGVGAAADAATGDVDGVADREGAACVDCAAPVEDSDGVVSKRGTDRLDDVAAACPAEVGADVADGAAPGAAGNAGVPCDSAGMDAHRGLGWGCRSRSSSVSEITTEDGTEGRCACRKGNWDSSNTAWRETITRLVDGS